MMNGDNGLVALLLTMFTVGAFAIGYTVGDVCEHSPLQDAAVERGYAEWVVPENGRGETTWRWIKPVEDHPND